MSSNKKNKSSKYTEDWLPIKNIQNGMIILDNNEKVSGVKIMPKNIFILDESSQQSTLFNLKNLYTAIDYEFWIICADRPVDISVYLSELNVLYNKTQVPSIRKMILEDIEKANNFMNNNVVDTEYYLLFKTKDEDIIEKRIRNLIGNFASCGLNSMRVSNDDLRVVMENFLNGGMTTPLGGVM